MKRMLLPGLLMLLPLCMQAREATVAAPGGNLLLTVSDEGGQPTYALELDGRQVLLPSALGFKADFGDFTQGLKIVGTKAERVDKQYEMRQVKQSHFHYVAMLLTVDFENAKQ
ncbi:MAG: glycoside hydrolase family 97 N-terminal domain-containing protein, partial [Prevotella sp.]